MFRAIYEFKNGNNRREAGTITFEKARTLYEASCRFETFRQKSNLDVLYVAYIREDQKE